MKKLMMTLAVVALAAATQAAQWTWSISAMYPLYKPDTETGNSGTAYLYAYSSESLAQAALTSFVADYAAENLTPSGYVTTQSVSDGLLTENVAMSSDPYSGIVKGDTVYWAMIVETSDGLFVDYVAAVRNADNKNRTISFSETGNSDNVFVASAGYQGAGYYAVPEPTSGLLFLLGMAGLALRRRRA